MLENIRGDSWGSIPPLRMLSLLPHDLCHEWNVSRRLLALWYFHSLSLLQPLKKVNQSCSDFSDIFLICFSGGQFLALGLKWWGWKLCFICLVCNPLYGFCLGPGKPGNKTWFSFCFLLLLRTNFKERRGRCAVTSTKIQLDSSLMQFALCFQQWNLS